jgi:DNA modification methylase
VCRREDDQMDPLRIINGDCIEVLKTLPAESVHCCVTSPPYWGLRDYGVVGQIGLEETPEEFLSKMVDVFREVRRVLRSDGTCWVNLGDSYASCGKNRTEQKATAKSTLSGSLSSQCASLKQPSKIVGDLKSKDLVGMPWRVALALQADGWYLRCDIIWHKPNPMPESVTDRPTKSHEYVFLLTKSERYFYDAEAVKEPVTGNAHARGDGVNKKIKVPHGWETGAGSHGAIHREGRHQGPSQYKVKQNESFSSAINGLVSSRNKRSVWTIPSHAYPEAHFATFPPDLVKPCVLAGCPLGGGGY